MRIPRIYQNAALQPSQELDLDELASKHVGRVLRMQVGQSIELFDGQGHSALADIVQLGKKHVSACIKGDIISTLPSPLSIHLGQVMSKGDRMDYAIQKAVELGVTEITPLFSERCDVKLNSERSDKKLKHWQGIIISACEQCRQNFLPLINEPISISKWMNSLQADLKCLFHPVNARTFAEMAEHPRPNSVAIVVGPEGGFSDAEIAELVEHNFSAFSLGPRILRTETAPIVALTLIQNLWGDF